MGPTMVCGFLTEGGPAGAGSRSADGTGPIIPMRTNEDMC